MKLPLLPCEPLLAHMKARGVSLYEMNRRLSGSDCGTAHRLATKPMRWYVADKFAVALGMHPFEIWGDEWWQVAEVFRERRNDKREKYRARKKIREMTQVG